MAGFKAGVLMGAGIIAIPAFFLLEKVASEPTRFPGKTVSVMDGYVSVLGSIVGDERIEAERPANNMVEMKCRKRDMTCSFLSINELTAGHIGWPSTDTLLIRTWTDKDLVADSLTHSGIEPPCNYYEVRVLFDTEDVTYTRIPNPDADQTRCEKLFGNKGSLRQWRIDDGKGVYGYTPGEE